MNLAIALAVGLIAILATSAFTSPVRTRRPSFGIETTNLDTPDRRFRIPTQRHAPTVVSPGALATWADDLARTLRHGSTLRGALTTVPPANTALITHTEPLRHWLGRGATVIDACDEWSDHLAHTLQRPTDRSDLLTTLSAVLAATAALGGTASAPLDRFAVTMRQRASDDLERSAHSAQAQMSARVLTIVPLAVLALLLITDDGVRTIITSPTGAIVVLIGLTLNATGAWWMRRIVGSATPSALTATR
jgi:Flp pilus assembly protein TadB